ncbi:MAG: alpha/beta hydrolase [Betaproteobacteria bacterium RIFCSPLOWO2_12_FULL_67_28]|nr:MAG: alpha/beta hydrolase [Betaproteobacteria bacterium RIFCSPLOWO2_02_FULL_68_150]OGA61176.1 MAG: alpha/beta hydrolase [Betaproteobacteria bacterium RIFCSPLOWO2_12_FULL_67_28]
MRAATRRAQIVGPAGRIELAIDLPAAAPRGVALVAHPHPLHGGTLDNKVVQTLARAFAALGYVALRPNFRGVGASGGRYDEGQGEVDDLNAVWDHARREYGAARPVLAGFSFGAAMQARLAARVPPERMALVGIAVNHFDAPAVPANTLLIHGERDQTVPLEAVLDWARPLELPVIVVPGSDHFFHGRLPLLRGIVEYNWR